MMILFFKHLIQKLDHERKNWRSQYFWVLDNASWHKSSKVLRFLEEHTVPVLYTGSYSYDAVSEQSFFLTNFFLQSPIELLYASFKS